MKNTFYSQSTVSMVKYGQVNQDTATQTKPAGMVNTTTHHHQILRFRRRLIKRRKKNRKANLTGKITNHQRVEAAFSFLETSATLSKISKSRPFPPPWRISAMESYWLCTVLYAKPVVPHKQTTANRSKTSSVENCLRMRALI